MAAFVKTPFKVSFSDEQLQDLQDRLKSARPPVKTFESYGPEKGLWGVEGEWMESVLKHWQTGFDWRKQEARINEVSQFTSEVAGHDGHVYTIHYICEMSPNPDAVPIIATHGWPGSFLEFIEFTKVLKATGKFHVVIPSIPGFTFSSRPPVERDITLEEVADVFHNLMVELGFQDGYVAQGGDLGSVISRMMAARHPEVAAVLFNLIPTMSPPKSFVHAYFPNAARWTVPDILGPALHTLLSPIIGYSAAHSNLSAQEIEGIKRYENFIKDGAAYGAMHCTRPATSAWTVSASPVGLLAWIGEKYNSWTDVDPPVDEILTSVTTWWCTNTYPTSIWAYRHLYGNRRPAARPTKPELYIHQPCGYSLFPKEIMPAPQAWAAQTCNLTWFRRHDAIGHFPSWEAPEVLAKDCEDFFLPVFDERRRQVAAAKQQEV